MNRKEAKDLLPIIQALAEGKTIETSGKDKDGNIIWVKTDNPRFNLSSKYYRINHEPKYRPFKSQEECWEEMHKHPDFGWLKSKDTGDITLIGNITVKGDKNVYITFATSEGYNALASNVFDYYTFTDGTPFGIKEE